jgi:toxin ParE1/3/4
MNIGFHKDAERELRESIEYYEEHAPDLGSRFASEVEEATQLIARHPGIAHEDRGLRHLVLTDFPYTLIYRVAEETVLILAVSHHSRNHGYWKSRDTQT